MLRLTGRRWYWTEYCIVSVCHCI